MNEVIEKAKATFAEVRVRTNKWYWTVLTFVLFCFCKVYITTSKEDLGLKVTYLVMAIVAMTMLNRHTRKDRVFIITPDDSWKFITTAFIVGFITRAVFAILL